MAQEINYPYEGDWFAEYDRMMQTTTVTLGGSREIISGHLDVYRFDIDGNRTRDASKLEPGDVVVQLQRRADSKTIYSIVLSPQPDKSVKVYKVQRWEMGVAHYAKD